MWEQYGVEGKHFVQIFCVPLQNIMRFYNLSHVKSLFYGRENS